MMQQIDWTCFLNRSGYAQSALDYIYTLKSLNQYDVKVSLFHPLPDQMSLTAQRYQEIMQMIRKERDPNAIQILHCIPEKQRLVPRSKRNVAFATFETFEPPAEWVAALNENEAIICPSEFNVKIFERAGVKKPIHYVPHCFNPYEFNPQVEPMHTDERFTFIFMGTWRKRKGYRQLLEAWMKEFDYKDPVRLMIKTDKYTIAHRTIAEVKNELGLSKKDIAPIVFEGRVLSDAQIPQFLKSADCLISPSLGEGFGLCFHPNTRVSLYSEPSKIIKNLSIGDCVVSPAGKKTHVIGKSVRKININEKLITIKTIGSSLTVTEDHEVLSYRNGLFAFKKARNFSIGDGLYIPKKKINTLITKKIDVSELIKCEKDSDFIFRKMGFSGIQPNSISKICSQIGCSKKQVELARKYISKKSSTISERSMFVVDYIKNMPMPQVERYKRYLDINEDFMYFLGWYMAEGSGGKSKLELSLGMKDKPHIERLCLIADHFGIKPKIKYVDNKIRIICTGALCETFEKICGKGAKTKCLPEFLYANHPLLLTFIKAYLQGDGCVKRKKANLVRFSSTSRYLLEQIGDILLCMGIWNTISDSKRLDYELSVRGIFAIKLSKLLGITLETDCCKSFSKVKDLGEGFLLPVLEVNTVDADMDEVYDIEVADTEHAFVASGVVVHNCPMQAMAVGVPVIVSRNTGMLEYANDETVTFIEPNGHIVYQDMDGIKQFANKKWSYIEVKEIANKMRYVLENTDNIKNKADFASKYVLDKFSYTVVAQQLRSMVESIT